MYTSVKKFTLSRSSLSENTLTATKKQQTHSKNTGKNLSTQQKHRETNVAM
jgi:hypothetical protein